jgi:V8-like Glu-specific endopeptidase
MIEFACPKCQAVLSAPEGQAGNKTACPKCGQRLLVPKPAENRTMLGKLLPKREAAPAVHGPAPGPQTLVEGGRPQGVAAGPPPVLPPGAGPKQPVVSATASPELKVAEWYYTRGGKQAGPVSWPQLRYLTACGQVSPNERVWTQGMANWTPAHKVQGLFPKAPAGRPGGAQLFELKPSGGKAPWRWIGLGGGIVVLAAVAALLIVVWNRNKGEAGPPERKEPEAKKQLTRREIFARSSKSVARIEGPLGSGTGFLVAPGILATNAHVVEGQVTDLIKVTFPGAREEGDKPLTPKCLSYNRKRDLAFLKVDTKLPPLPVSKEYKFDAGEEVTIIGNPSGLKNAVAFGVLSTQKEINGKNFFQISTSINPGNSGGPVFDSFGEVIGVVTLKSGFQEGIAYCVPHDDLRDGIDQVTGQSAEASAQEDAKYNARVVFTRVAVAGGLYGFMMKHMCEAGEAAVREGKSPADAMSRVRAAIYQEIRDKKREYLFKMDDVEACVSRVGSDNRLSDSVRQNLNRLWTTYTEMKDYVESPRGSLADFRTKWRDRTDEHKRVVEALRVALGVDNEELEFKLR